MNNYGFSDTTVESELRDSGVYISVTKGTSMRPLLKTNRDIVVLKKVEKEPVKYDVVLYRDAGGKYLLHRIIKVTPDRFIIRGDNTYVRERVSKDRIIAVLTEYKRKGKKHSTRDFGYRFYSRAWNFIYPIRFLLHKARVLLGRIKRALFKKRKNTKKD